MQAIKLTAYILTLLSFTAYACKKDTVAPQQVVIKSPLTQLILDSSQLVATVFSDTAFTVSEGVEETDIHFLNKKGYSTRVFILKVDMNHPGVRLQAGTPYGLTGFALQTVPDMAKYIDSSGNRVMAALNADFFSTTGEPRGVVIKDGKVMKTTWANARSQTFLGVLNNGKAYIGERADFPVMQPQLKDALGGGPMLVKENELQTQTDLSIEPRTAVGISDNGVLYFAVVDGRSFYYSNGMTLPEMGMLLKACGATKAINLDGGGSSTFMIRHPLADVWQVRNKPSDGNNRAVGNGWMIINGKP
ncbi:phosphodiester glycosidase family protein [Chitinophaga sp. MM2321]|uniref:phosphodiester glycosidase family protein n=1 Tax=Chitinophaga sp. MM2321 TaxID=3137178 RepID=UPI0032D58E52